MIQRYTWKPCFKKSQKKKKKKSKVICNYKKRKSSKYLNRYIKIFNEIWYLFITNIQPPNSKRKKSPFTFYVCLKQNLLHFTWANIAVLCRAEDNLQWSVFSFYYASPSDQTMIVRICSTCFYPQRHLTNLVLFACL